MNFVDTLLLTARSTLGWKETAPNDAPFIRVWLADVGVKQPAPWCMAAVYQWVKIASQLCGVVNPCPKTASTAELFDIVTAKQLTVVRPQPGDVAIWKHIKDGTWTRKGHVGVVTSASLVKFSTIEGNTNAEGSRNGNCVAEHNNTIGVNRKDLVLACFARFTPNSEVA